MGEHRTAGASPNTQAGRSTTRPQRAAARLASNAVQKDANRDGLRDDENDEITPLRGSAPAIRKKQPSRKQRKPASVPKKTTEITAYMSARKGDPHAKKTGEGSRAASGSNEEVGKEAKESSPELPVIEHRPSAKGREQSQEEEVPLVPRKKALKEPIKAVPRISSPELAPNARKKVPPRRDEAPSSPPCDSKPQKKCSSEHGNAHSVPSSPKSTSHNALSKLRRSPDTTPAASPRKPPRAGSVHEHSARVPSRGNASKFPSMGNDHPPPRRVQKPNVSKSAACSPPQLAQKRTADDHDSQNNRSVRPRTCSVATLPSSNRSPENIGRSPARSTKSVAKSNRTRKQHVPNGNTSTSLLQTDNIPSQDPKHSVGSSHSEGAHRSNQRILNAPPAARDLVMSTLLTIARDVRSVFQSVDDLKGKLQTMEVTMAEIRTGIVTKAAANVLKPSGGGAISRYNNIMNDLAPNVLLYFPSKLWSGAIFFACIEHAWIQSEFELVTTDGFLKIMYSMAFSLSGNKSLDNFSKTDHGKVASEFRNLIISRAIQVAQSGIHEPDQTDDGRVVEANPFWLEQGTGGDYISAADIKIAQTMCETSSSGSEEYKNRLKIGNGTRQPTQSDIAQYVCTKIYKHMSDLFRKRKRNRNNDFTSSFGYLFLPWERHNGICVLDASLQLRFVQANADIKYVYMSNVPDTIQKSSDGRTCASRNQDLLKDWEKRPELNLWVSHDCTVVPSREGATRLSKNDEPEIHTYPHVINLMTPIATIFRAWAGYDSKITIAQLMILNRNTLRVLYGLGVMLREVTIITANPTPTDGLSTQEPATVACSEKDREKLFKYFHTLLPCESNTAQVLATALLNIPQPKFDKSRKTLDQAINQ